MLPCIELKFIEKGKLYQNFFMERFNRSFREEVLDASRFYTKINLLW